MLQTVGDVQERVIASVLAERRRQDDLFGRQLESPPATWIAMIAEELGEAARPALTMAGIDPRGGRSADLQDNATQFRKELIQVAALAIKALECVEYHQATLNQPTNTTDEIDEMRRSRAEPSP